VDLFNVMKSVGESRRRSNRRLERSTRSRKGGRSRRDDKDPDTVERWTHDLYEPTDNTNTNTNTENTTTNTTAVINTSTSSTIETTTTRMEPETDPVSVPLPTQEQSSKPVPHTHEITSTSENTIAIDPSISVVYE
jgi:hypothetical protein